MIELLKKSSFFIVIGIGFIIFLYVTKDGDAEKSSTELNSVEVSPIEMTEENNVGEDDMKAIVDVKGEVMRPGVYEMEMDARVNDVIQIAGGFSLEADQSQVNLAQKVQDEMIIFIPTIGDVDQGNAGSSSGSGKIKINYASLEEIQGLNGIGPSKAQAIIQYREEHGLFKSLEELLDVSGIGEKTLEALREEIQVP